MSNPMDRYWEQMRQNTLVVLDEKLTRLLQKGDEWEEALTKCDFEISQAMMRGNSHQEVFDRLVEVFVRELA